MGKSLKKRREIKGGNPRHQMHVVVGKKRGITFQFQQGERRTWSSVILECGRFLASP